MEQQQEQQQGMSQVVERNIQALLERQKKKERKQTVEDSLADVVTRFTGSMPFVYLHLLIFGIWILWNTKALGFAPFDPSFVILAMFASVEAIFLSTFVLISQNRMNKIAQERADLDLQISLLTEHEVTRMITLVKAIAVKLEIAEAGDPEIPELEKDVKPEKVMDTMDQEKEKREK